MRTRLIGNRWPIVVVALLSIPLVVWTIWWIRIGWLPQGDTGIIALKVHAVFSSHPPLQGMRSTSAQSVPDAWAHHLGPLEFYLLAVPYAAAGWHPAGLVIGCLALAVAMVALAVWQALLVGGRPAVWLVVVAVVVAELVIGGSLVSPWNPFPPVLALITLLVLGWRLFAGQVSAMPWFAGVLSLVLQANLALVPVVAPLLLVLVGVGLLRWHRVRGSVWPAPGWRPKSPPVWWRRPGAISVGVLLLAWLPSIVELWAMDPNNAVELAKLGVGTIDGPFRMLGLLAVLGASGWLVWRIGGRPLPVQGALRYTSGLMLAGIVLALAAGGLQRGVYLVMAVGGGAFAIAAWCQRPISSGVRAVRRLAPAPAVVAVGVMGALGVGLLTGPSAPLATGLTAAELTWVRRAQPVIQDTMNELRSHGVRTGPVVIKYADGWAWASYQTALAARLSAEGYTPFYDSTWRYPEDDAFRRIALAPPGAPTVTLRDGPSTITLP